MNDSPAASYLRRYPVLKEVAPSLREHVKQLLDERLQRVDSITARAKEPASFARKALKIDTEGNRKYSEPLRQIQDQIGVRVTVYYLDDVERIGGLLQGFFRHIERRAVVPDSESEFGYFGRHWVNILPIDVIPPNVDEGQAPEFFELQVKTLFQHAWSEAEHDLGYKPDVPLTSEQKRLLAFASAQAWGADRVFEEIRQGLVEKSGPH